MICRFAASWADPAALDAATEHALQRVQAIIEAASSMTALARFRSIDLRGDRATFYSLKVSDTIRVRIRVIDDAPSADSEAAVVEIIGFEAPDS